MDEENRISTKPDEPFALIREVRSMVTEIIGLKKIGSVVIKYTSPTSVTVELKNFSGSEESNLAVSDRLQMGNPFWTGSVSDLVYTFDTLQKNGYVKAIELDEAVAESFDHLPKGAKTKKKLTAKKIDGRRRNMRMGSHTFSEKIANTVTHILKELPANNKKLL